MQPSAIVLTPLSYAPAWTQIAYSDQCHEIRTPQMKHMILNVDSDPQLHRLLFIVLDPADFKIVKCLTGMQATRLSISTKSDLALLDLTQSDVEGKVVVAVRTPLRRRFAHAFEPS